MSLYRFEGNLQYPTRSEADTFANYLTNNWLVTYSQYVRAHPDNGHTVYDLDPPYREDDEPELCVAQVDLVYHTDIPSSPGEPLYNEIYGGIQTAAWAGAACGSRGVGVATGDRLDGA